MRLNMGDPLPSRSGEPQSQGETERSQMTPARRAALDALERELRDLLNAEPRL